jgi:hypothetical protein
MFKQEIKKKLSIVHAVLTNNDNDNNACLHSRILLKISGFDVTLVFSLSLLVNTCGQVYGIYL